MGKYTLQLELRVVYFADPVRVVPYEHWAETLGIQSPFLLADQRGQVLRCWVALVLLLLRQAVTMRETSNAYH